MEFFYILVLVCVVFLGWQAYTTAKQKKRMLNTALSFVFLRVLMPRKESDLDEKKESGSANATFKDVISVMEQLLASFHEIGKDNYLVFEYAVVDGQLQFYIAVPMELQLIVEKQLTSFYPDAILEAIDEYDIFGENSVQEACELVMKKEYNYPLKTYQQLESDPINNITNSLSKLGTGEGALIQIIVKPEPDKWQDASKKLTQNILEDKKKEKLSLKSIFKDVLKIFTESPSEKKPDEQKRTTPLTEEMAKAVESKSHKVGFDTIIRIVTSSSDSFLAKAQLQGIVSAFVQFNHPRMNSLEKSKKVKSAQVIANSIFRLFSRSRSGKKMILSTEEIAGLFHPPHVKYNKSPAIRWQKSKIVAPPDNLPKEGLLLGFVDYRGMKQEVRVKTEDRFRHFYIIGQTGTGKSTILETMCKQDFRNNQGLCVMDPHGELADKLLPYIPRSRADDVIVFDPSDLSRPLGINLLEAEDEDEKELVSLDAMNMMIKLFGPEIFGPRIQDYFRNGVLTLMADPEGGTIVDVLALFVNNDFQQKKRSHLKNPIVKSWWDNTFDGMGDREKQEMIPFFAAKFGQFTTNSTIRNIIGQTKSSFDMSQIMQEGKILVVRMAKGLIGDINAQLLGMILVSKIQVAAMRRQKIKTEDRKDFFLYIDEFQNFVTDSIESILSEARKYRVGLVLAHQYMDQLEKKGLGGETNLKGAIFGNVGSVMSYKVGEIDAEFLSKVYAPVFSEQDISNQEKFKAIMRLSIDQQPSVPFNYTVQKSFEMEGYPRDEEAAEAFIQLSRLKYGRQKEFVDQEIRYRLGAL